jgi:hypothetical protein
VAGAGALGADAVFALEELEVVVVAELTLLLTSVVDTGAVADLPSAGSLPDAICV